MQTKSIAIIGAGTAGLASAILLSTQGFICDLYEEFQEPKALGAGILLQPQGLQVLSDMKLVNEILNRGAKINTLFGQNTNKRIIMDFNYRDLCDGLYGLGIHRGTLFDLLFRKAIKLVNKLYLGHKVNEVEQNSTAVKIITNQNLVTSYDLVVIANGTWSTLTKNLNVKKIKNPYPWGALWKIFEHPDNLSEGLLSQRYNKCHTMAGMLPSGTHPVTQKKCISFFWSLKADQYEEWKNSDIILWKDKVVHLWPEIKSYINQISQHDDLTFAHYADTTMEKWHDDKIVVLGDAAHAMSPQLGQGANMALVDAWQLSESLTKNSITSIALANYSYSRRKHLKFYQYASRLLTPFFQSNSSIAAIFRDLLFPSMRYFPMAKKHALTTLFGVKTSLLSNKPNIDLTALAKMIKD